MEFSTIVLASFNAVANFGSIAAASQHLNVAGSVVSRNIKRLEDMLQITLFERSVRGMRLTPAGEYFAAYTRRARLEQDVALGHLRNWSNELDGHIRLSVSEGLSTTMAPEMIGAFREHAPKVTFMLASVSQDKAFQALERGETDIAILFDGHLSLNIEVLACETFHSSVLMAPNHPLADKSILSMADIGRFPFTTSDHSTTRRLLERVMSLRGQRLDVAMTCSTSVSMYNLCATTQTLNIACYLSSYRFVERGYLVARDFEDSVQLQRSVMITVMRGRHIPAHLQKFIDFAADRLRDYAIGARAGKTAPPAPIKSNAALEAAQ